MRLHDLLDATEVLEVVHDAPVDVSDITDDSRSVRPGTLFCCVPGARVDGHDFAPAALAGGASALLVDRELQLAVPQVVVPSVRRAMGPLSDRYFGHPSEAMRVVGITGTNGKTSTAFILGAVLQSAGYRPAILGTAGARFDDEVEPWGFTTPEAPALQRTLASFRSRGADAIAMEVSSHALAEHRVDGTRFAVAAFTNLTRDHLDYHGTLEEYFGAKAMLFAPTFTDRAVVNRDDPFGISLIELASEAGLGITTYAVDDPTADVRAEAVVTDLTGNRFRLATPGGDAAVVLVLRGRFNVANALAAAAVGIALDLDLAPIVAGLEAAAPVPGRFEAVESDAPIGVIVDYAHTATGIVTALEAARTCTDGRVIAVFGCGGDRDAGKREEMGRAAGTAADLVVVTTDNPRSEDPATIARAAAAGVGVTATECRVELDRRAAIHAAIADARSGDIVVVLGKGAETTQVWADHSIPFDDRVVAAEALRSVWN